MTKGLSHIDEAGAARMVDVSEKKASARRAVAEGFVAMADSTRALIVSGGMPKGDVLAAARLAGIMAAKKTAELIPLCHPLALTKVEVDLQAAEGGIRISATVAAHGPTGVEMEALTAVSVAALTLYDMAKSAEKAMRIEGIRLVEKTGGKSDWTAP